MLMKIIQKNAMKLFAVCVEHLARKYEYMSDSSRRQTIKIHLWGSRFWLVFMRMRVTPEYHLRSCIHILFDIILVRGTRTAAHRTSSAVYTLAQVTFTRSQLPHMSKRKTFEESPKIWNMYYLFIVKLLAGCARRRGVRDHNLHSGFNKSLFLYSFFQLKKLSGWHGCVGRGEVYFEVIVVWTCEYSPMVSFIPPFCAQYSSSMWPEGDRDMRRAQTFTSFGECITETPISSIFSHVGILNTWLCGDEDILLKCSCRHHEWPGTRESWRHL